MREIIYPSAKAMPPAVAEDVGTALRRFETALGRQAPRVLEALQPGLSEGEITAIEDKHGVRLTDDLKAFYRWRNGSAPASPVDLIPTHRFVPLEESIRMRDLMNPGPSAPLAQRATHAIVANSKGGWLPILDDGAGDGYFYDPARGEGQFFYHFAEDGEYRFFPCLANFLIGASECFETGIYRVDPKGLLDEDFVRSFALWPRYASGRGM